MKRPSAQGRSTASIFTNDQRRPREYRRSTRSFQAPAASIEGGRQCSRQTSSHQARAISVSETGRRPGSKLKKRGAGMRPAPARTAAGAIGSRSGTKKNVWHCRGCATGGDVIKLEMHVNGLSFVDAVEGADRQKAGTPNATPADSRGKSPQGWRERPSGAGPRPKSRRAMKAA